MIYKLLFFCVCVGVATCSRHYRSSEDSVTTTVPNETHRNHSGEITSTITPDEMTVKDKVEVKVYYETLCPASVSFITEVLRPALEEMPTHLDVHLVPYGFAKTISDGGSYKFKCQHGAAECYGNKVHACVVDVLQNNTQAVLFNACLMDHAGRRSKYESVLNRCTSKLNLPVDGVWDCVNGERGSVLLKNNGEEMDAWDAPYVPYLILDGSSDNQDQARDHFISTVCGMLKPKPEACDGFMETSSNELDF